MKILELLLTPKIGGAHTLAGNLATEWRAAGHEVAFLALDAPRVAADSTHLEEIFGATITIAQAGPHSRFPIQQISRLLGMHRYLRDHRPDVIHAHSLMPNLYGRMAAAFQAPRIPVVITLHAPASADYSRFLVRLTENLLTPYTNAAVAVSSEIGDEHKALFRRRVQNLLVIPNGVAVPLIEREVPSGRAPTKFLATSRISAVKDIATMVRGFDRFASFAEDVELIIAGPFDEPTYKEEILQLHQLLVNRERIRFLGSRDDVASLLGWADAFVHTALSEVHPLSILEAAASGLPIVATAIPGIKASLGPNAEYFQPGNHEDLTAALGRLRDSWPAPATRARSLAPEIRTQFSMSACAKTYLELFSTIIRRRSLDFDFQGDGGSR